MTEMILFDECVDVDALKHSPTFEDDLKKLLEEGKAIIYKSK